MNKITFNYWKLYSLFKYGFHPKPHYLYRTIKSLFKAKILKQFAFRGLDFAITFTCNFNCEHCYAKRLKDLNRKELQVSDYKRICNEAMRLGVASFSFQGGEIFLNNMWREIIKASQPHKNHVVITTNGSLIDEYKILILKQLGVDCMYFSIDSGIPEEHDKFRNHKGSFAKIMDGIALCKKHGMKIIINTCVGKHNISSSGLKKILDFSHKNRILICTLLARPAGNWKNRFDVLLGDKEMLLLQQLRKQYPFSVRDLSNNFGKVGCQAVKEYLYISAYGDVCPCPFTHIVLGNILNESLSTIRDRGLASKWWNHYHSVCLTGRDQEFMSKYYPLIEKKPLITLEEFER